MRGSRGGTGGPEPPPLKNQKSIVCLTCSNNDPDTLKNHKTILNTNLAFNIWPLSAHDGPLLVILGSSLPSLTKNKLSGSPF